MKIDLNSPGEEVRIEIVPLIDVIFCILTFFILAAVGLTRQQAIEVDLPRAQTGERQMRDMLLVSLSPAGQLYIDRSPVGRDRLEVQARAFKRANPDGRIVLYASQSAFYSDVIAVLDLLRQFDGRVALATLPGDPDTFDPGAIEPLAPNSPNLFEPQDPGQFEPFDPFAPLPEGDSPGEALPGTEPFDPFGDPNPGDPGTGDGGAGSFDPTAPDGGAGDGTADPTAPLPEE